MIKPIITGILVLVFFSGRFATLDLTSSRITRSLEIIHPFTSVAASEFGTAARNEAGKCAMSAQVAPCMAAVATARPPTTVAAPAPALRCQIP